jgi:2-polyprenyl-3-methyl-5-hydroxy-6-metoxy-1,4-benzoquinol methylase
MIYEPQGQIGSQLDRRPGSAAATADRLETRTRQLFEARHGTPRRMGWNPRLRHRFGYFSPDDYYDALVEGLIDRDTEWLDVGGGSAIFPSNPNLARTLADRCKRLVVVDPSSNANENPFAHERCQSFLEELEGYSGRFTLATARMVAEHVAHPERFIAKLGQVLKPEGKAVIYTVNRWAPMTILSGCTPMPVHHFVKKRLWGAEEKDTFPVTYLMNTRSRLKALFAAAGFREIAFHRLDDCRTLAKWKTTLAFELMMWKALRSVSIGYPESCIIGVYERSGDAPAGGVSSSI